MQSEVTKADLLGVVSGLMLSAPRADQITGTTQMDVRAAAAEQLAPLLTATFLGSTDEQLRTGLCPQLSDALLSLEAAAGLSWRIQKSVIVACAGYATP